MPSFAEVLRSHQSGELDRDGLLAEVDRVLASTPELARNLLTYVHAEHAGERLSTTTHTVVVRRIRDWLEDRTIVSPAALRDDTVDVTDSNGLAQMVKEIGAFHAQANALPADRPGTSAMVGVGTVLLQRFQLIEQIGEGGMSRVYKAVDLRKVEAESVDPHVAVKVLALRFEDHFRSSAVLHREAHKLQSLTHPNIVRVIDCDRDDQTVFMTMEYLAGESLKERLNASGRALQAQESAHIIASIASALEFAHRGGIVHGDLKPGNVILTHKGEIKIIDFGIARFIARSTTDQVQPEANEISALTPPYASPQMLDGVRPDARDDVFALACMAYELLAGRHPFDRIAANVARDKQLTPAHSDLLTAAQWKAISAALAFDRDQRTSSVREFIEQFKGPGEAPVRRYVIYACAGLAALFAGYYISVLFRQPAAPAPVTVARSTLTEPGSVFRDCPTCPLMVVLPPGTFVQGSNDDTDFERPQHPVAIDYALAMGQREITVGEFKEYIETTARQVSGCSVYDGEWQTRSTVSWDTLDKGQTALHPVSCVSWDDATAYAQWLTSTTHQSYRLASASEWEYAAIASQAPSRPSSRQVCVSANVADQSSAQSYPGWQVHECRDGYVHAAPVGSFAANAFGLYDMLGNVVEWTQDCWNESYTGAPATGAAWSTGDCTQHETRGGSWFTTPNFLRAGYRSRFAHDYRSATVGFRVVRVINTATDQASRPR